MSCSALNRRGQPCRSRVRAGSDRCYAHARPVDELEAEALESIRRAAVDDWRAAAWLLERRLPGRYARPAQRTGEERPPPEPAVSADGLDELAAQRAARRSAG